MLTLIIDFTCDGEHNMLDPIQFTTRENAVNYIKQDIEKYCKEQNIPMVDVDTNTDSDKPIGDTHTYYHKGDCWTIDKLNEDTNCGWTIYEPKVDPEYKH